MNRQHKHHPTVREHMEKPAVRGQHLLHNKRLIEEMIAEAKIGAGDLVLDIGAGKGAITLPLAVKAGKVLAVENDPDLAEALRRKSEGYGNIQIIEKDFLKARLPKEPYCVIANIPFFITTPILEKLLDPVSTSFQRGVLIIQIGAARGYTADPIRNPRILTWRMWFEMELVKAVPSGHFSPPPSVEAAVFTVRRKRNTCIPPHHHRKFAALAEYALRAPDLPVCEALNGIFTPPQMKRLIRNIGIDRHRPVCTLNERQWGIVFHTMLEHVEPFRWPRQRR